MYYRTLPVAFVCLSATFAQDFDHYLANTDSAVVSVQLDRAIYFPCEEIITTAAVSNAKNGPLQVPDPFASTGSSFLVLMRDPKAAGTVSEWRPTIDDAQPSLATPDTPIVGIPGGGSLTRTFGFQESQPGQTAATSAPILFALGPSQPGSYRMLWFYKQGGPVEAAFEVASPVVESVSISSLGPRRSVVMDGESVSVQDQVAASVLRYQGTRYICFSLPVFTKLRQSQFSAYVGVAAPPATPFQDVGPYRRVFQTTDAINGLAIQPDQSGGFFLSWTDGSGGAHSLRLDVNRNPI